MKVPGTRVPGNKSTRERKFHVWGAKARGNKSSCYPILLQISRGRCTLRNAELRKGVFCGTKIAENVLVVELRLVLELGLVIAAYSVLLAIKF